MLLEQLKPYDETARELAKLLPPGVPTVFAEEGIFDGGASMILTERLRETVAPSNPFRILAIRDGFASPEKPCDLLASLGLDGTGIADAVFSLLQ